MTLYTPLNGLPYPQPTDTANLPLHLQSLAEGIDGRTILRYPTAADRDTTITTPAAGMVAWLTAPGVLSYYTGTAWIALGAWNSYTPTWTAATTNPAIGDGTLTGKYAVVGKVCHFTTFMVFGSTTTFGNGVYSFGLPVTGGTPGGLAQFTGMAISPGGPGSDHLSAVDHREPDVVHPLGPDGLYGVLRHPADRQRRLVRQGLRERQLHPDQRDIRSGLKTPPCGPKAPLLFSWPSQARRVSCQQLSLTCSIRGRGDTEGWGPSDEERGRGVGPD
ncbi:hypothetical protein AB0D78_07865 [Streptomyces avermitilis]|uniref:hypothetical protein n=1 Tax=Streptomyces avermitilis TaxID=33903 RepID=UPI0034015B90